jgi:hypothetical protein
MDKNYRIVPMYDNNTSHKHKVGSGISFGEYMPLYTTNPIGYDKEDSPISILETRLREDYKSNNIESIINEMRKYDMGKDYFSITRVFGTSIFIHPFLKYINER